MCARQELDKEHVSDGDGSYRSNVLIRRRSVVIYFDDKGTKKAS